MDALVAYGSGSEESDNGGEQQEQKQANHDEEDICREIPVPDNSTTSTSTMDLPLPSSRVPLPLELNCEIFKCLKLPIQRKFIWGLGRDIYGIFGQKLLKKTKRVCNPHGNGWKKTNTTATIEEDGLNVRKEIFGRRYVFAVQPFPITGPHCRVDGFPGTILYYYEIKGCLRTICLSAGAIPDDDDSLIGQYPNSYAIPTGGFYLGLCWLDGETHYFELPEGVIRPIPKDDGINVLGCGLVLDAEDKLSIFFTLNGKLRARKIPISPTVDRLFPAVIMWGDESLEANFGDDPAKPFKYDIKNCPGLELACI